MVGDQITTLTSIATIITKEDIHIATGILTMDLTEVIMVDYGVILSTGLIMNLI